MHSPQKRSLKAKILAGTAAGVLAIGSIGAGTLLTQADAAQRKAAVTPAQATAAIKTAVAARPGMIKELEVERKNGRIVCEVDILTSDGGSYEVTVDVETNKVLKIER